MTTHAKAQTVTNLPSSEKAPRPTRASYARSLYDAIRAVGGPADLGTIIELIPVTDDAQRWSTAKPKKVLQLLLNNKNYGYFAETPDGKWIIAPRDYFDARQQHLDDVKAGRVPRDKPGKHRKLIEVRTVVHAKWPELIAASAIGFALGMLVEKLF